MLLTEVDEGDRRPEADEAPETPRYDAQRLTAGGRRAHIKLNDQIYTLQITRQGKLLLTK